MTPHAAAAALCAGALAAAGCGGSVERPGSSESSVAAGPGTGTTTASNATGAGGSASAEATSSGAGGTAAGGSDATGGGGAAHVACDSLLLDGELSVLASVPGSLQWTLAAHRFTDTEALVTRTIAIPGEGPQTVVSSRVRWTDTWPPTDAGPVVLTDRPFYLVSPSPSTGEVAVLGPPKDGGLGVAFGIADPWIGGWTELLLTDAAASDPVLLSGDDAGTFFVGMRVPTDDGWGVPSVGWVSTAGDLRYGGEQRLGCPMDPVTAAGVAVDGGWLLARPVFAGCQGPDGLVEVTQFAGGSASDGATLPAVPWAWVELVARPEGAWLLYRGDGIQAARLDASGSIDGSTHSIHPDRQLLAADRVGPGFLVVAKEPERALLTVTVFDDALDTRATVPVSLPSAPHAVDVVFDEATRRALLVVVVDAATSPYTDVAVARLACE